MSAPPRPGMESLTLVLLRRPAAPTHLTEDESDRIQQAPSTSSTASERRV